MPIPIIDDLAEARRTILRRVPLDEVSVPAALRDSIERPEALDTGGIIMTGLDPANVVEAVTVAIAAGRTRSGVGHLTPEDYLIDNTSERVVNFIVSTARRHHQWAGIRSR